VWGGQTWSFGDWNHQIWCPLIFSYHVMSKVHVCICCRGSHSRSL
jgi:hypothetical protein